MFEVYADESGIHPGAKLCLMAGFAGGRQQWKSLERDWIEILKSAAISPTVGFHSKDFFKMSRGGVHSNQRYRHLDAASGHDLIRELSSAINSYKLFPIGAYLDAAYFRSLPLLIRQWLTGYSKVDRKTLLTGSPDAPYYTVLHEIVGSGARYAKSGVKCDFVMDIQNRYAGYALQLFAYLKNSGDVPNGERLGGMEFYSRFERVGLQACDLICYCISRCQDIETLSRDNRYAAKDIQYVLENVLKYGTSGCEIMELNRSEIDELLWGGPELIRKHYRDFLGV